VKVEFEHCLKQWRLPRSFVQSDHFDLSIVGGAHDARVKHHVVHTTLAAGTIISESAILIRTAVQHARSFLLNIYVSSQEIPDMDAHERLSFSYSRSSLPYL
jgi:hypothetical protein